MSWGILVVALMLLITLILKCLITRSIDLLEAFAFLLPFKSLVFDVGLMVWWFYIPLSILFIKPFLFKTKFRFPYSLFCVVSFFTITTAVISLFFLPSFTDNSHYSGFFRNEGRFISSIFKFCIFEMGIILVVINNARTYEKINSTLKSYLKGLLFIALLGICQFVIYFIAGIDIFPLRIIDGNPMSAPVNNVFTSSVSAIRISSLGGEPKGLSTSLVIGLTILFYAARHNVRLFSRTYLYVITYLIVLTLTFSRSGYGLFFVLMAILFFSYSWHFLKKKKIKLKPIYYCILIFAFLPFFWSPIYNFIDTRFFQSNSQLFSEDVDGVIQNYYLSNPEWLIFGAGLGNVHHIVTPSLPDKFSALRGHVFISRYGYSRIITEVGVVGFIILVSFFVGVISKLARFKSENAIFFRGIVICAFLYFLLRNNYVFSELLFLVGLSLAFLSINKSEMNTLT